VKAPCFAKVRERPPVAGNVIAQIELNSLSRNSIDLWLAKGAKIDNPEALACPPPSAVAAKLGMPRSALDLKIRSLKINTHASRPSH
jgi:hypothetical protein